MKSVSLGDLVHAAFHLSESQLSVLGASKIAASSFDLKKHHFLWSVMLMCERPAPLMRAFTSPRRKQRKGRKYTPGKREVTVVKQLSHVHHDQFSVKCHF